MNRPVKTDNTTPIFELRPTDQKNERAIFDGVPEVLYIYIFLQQLLENKETKSVIVPSRYINLNILSEETRRKVCTELGIC